MNSKALLVIAVIILGGCTSDRSPFGTDGNYDWSYRTITPDREEKRFLHRHPELATRDTDRLVLWFPGGGSLTLDNTPEEDCDGSACESYLAIGYWPEREAFLIDIPYYEGYEAGIVSRDWFIRIPNRPRFSPDRRMFVSTLSDYTPSAMVGSLEIWDFASPIPKKIFSFEYQDGISICDARWIGNHRVEMQTFDNHECGSGRSVFLERSDNGGWAARKER